MVCSKQANLDAFLREQPSADDANLNEELEEKIIARLLRITTHRILQFSLFPLMASFQSQGVSFAKPC